MCYVCLSQTFILLPGPVMQDRRYRVVSLFSGIAGLELGLRQSCAQELSSFFGQQDLSIQSQHQDVRVIQEKCQKHLVWSQVLRTLCVCQILSF